MATLEAWQRAVGDAALLRRVAEVGEPTPAKIERLRREHGAEEVAVAFELAAARRRARDKFGDACDRLIADVEGVEMATSLAVGSHKARRFVAGGIAEAEDLCSGIGGDAMALGASGVLVRAVDSDPVRAWMTGENAGCASVCADVTGARASMGAVHIDPARRGGRGRSWRLADLSPGMGAIRALIRACPACAVKLGPGLPRDEVSGLGELEFISEGGRLTNAVLWTGALDSGSPRRSTLLPHGLTLGGAASAPPHAPVGRWLHSIDPAVERAELLGTLCEQVGAGMPHPRAGVITSERAIDSAWVRAYEVVERMAWSERRVRAWLAAHDAGLVSIKTRGRVVDPDALQGRLRGNGATAYTLFVLRIGGSIEALITLPRERASGR